MIWKRLCLWSVSMSELKLENHLKTTESQSVPMLRQNIKWSKTTKSVKCKYVWTEVGKSSQNDRAIECPYVKAKYKNDLKTTMSLKCQYVWTEVGKSSQNDRVSDLVQLLWDNIFSKNDRVSDFSRHSRFQSTSNKRIK